MKVEFLKPGITACDIRRASESIKSGWLVHGKYTKEFETLLDKFLGNTTFMTASCTASLHMSLLMLGVGKGDEVITTPLSWVATANVILYTGAKVVFADVDPETGILDPNEAKKKITKRTKAIIVVHLYGQMADMREFSKLGVPIIEDAAHALEAKRDGIKPGQLGTACFSFHAAKNITCGQGGALTTNNKEKCKLLVRDGVTNLNGKRVMVDFGYKYDSTDFQAALLIGQLQRIKKSHDKRLQVYRRYEDAFTGVIEYPVRRGKHACHMFVIWVPNRDEVRAKLEAKGIQTSIHYTPIHKEPWYQANGFKNVHLPIAEKMGEEIITLPTYALSKKKQNYIIEEVLKCVSP